MRQEGGSRAIFINRSALAAALNGNGSSMSPLVTQRTAYNGRVMSAVERYRHLAEECLAASRLALTPVARAALIEMAGTWLRLAQEQDNDSIQPKDDAKD